MRFNAIDSLTVLTFLGFLAQTDCSNLKALFVIFRHGNRKFPKENSQIENFNWSIVLTQ